MAKIPGKNGKEGARNKVEVLIPLEVLEMVQSGETFSIDQWKEITENWGEAHKTMLHKMLTRDAEHRRNLTSESGFTELLKLYHDCRVKEQPEVAYWRIMLAVWFMSNEAIKRVLQGYEESHKS